MNIILTGYMGCGKSTVAAELKKLTGLEVLDTDKRIEEEEGMSISRIFAEKGEAFFRQLETDLLNRLLREGFEGILSTGGGMSISAGNRRLMKALGCVVYLRTMPETIAERLKHDESRPLLAGTDNEERIARIRDMLKKREGAYTDGADVVLDTDALAPAELAAVVLDACKSRENTL
ncbi:MAG: shikimate kinase [Lachnospiraceae bacterium]|nr:shikimate kinase [Lachnospiraceae bacterium]